MKPALLILASIILFLSHEIKAQLVYATTETNAKNGACSTCSVTNPPNAVSNDTTDFSVVNITVQTAGAQIWQLLRFPGVAAPGVYVYMVVEHPTQQPLTGANLAGVRLTSYLNNVSNFDTKQSNTYSITPYGPSKYLIGFMPAVSFDGIELRMIVQNPANPLGSIRLYTAFTSIAPLPVEMLYFTAAAEGTSVELKWATATETNNDHFMIERSADGIAYTAIGMLDGAGTTAFKTIYNYKDENVSAGWWYYRLKQTDHDGGCAYSEIASVRMNEDPDAACLYPNPCLEQEFYIDIEENDSEIELVSMKGERVLGQKLPAGNHVINIPAGLAQGIYYVVISSDLRTTMKKLVVK